MFENPSNREASPIDPGRYVAKLIKLEQMPPSEAHPDWGPSIKWVFHLATYPTAQQPSTVIRQQDGEPWEFWQNTSMKLSPKSTARPWVEALLGRHLVEGQDTGESIAAELIDRKAVVVIGPKTMQDGSTRDRILSIQPYTSPAVNGKKADPEPEPEPVGAAAGASLLTDEEL